MTVISRTILIIDDSPEDRELYRRYLLRDPDYDYTILEASLGQQGLEFWQHRQPDAVLLDYRLPDLDGLEFLAQLHSPTSSSSLPVIVVTGQGNEAIAVQAIKAGAQDYLVKGAITPESLHLAVNGAIATVQLQTQLQQRIDRERLVLQITQKICQSLDLEEILQMTVDEVRQFLQTDRVLIFQLQPDGNGTVVAESVGAEWRSLLDLSIHDPCLAENYLRFSRPESVTHDVAFAEEYVKRYRQGNVTAIEDIHASNIDPCHVELLAQFQVQANLVVPILHDNHFWGLLIAHHCAAPRSWQTLEIDLLKELAIQVSIALRQAELYRQAQDELAERTQVEAELRESEERLRLALQASRMGTWDWNIQTGAITWSDNLEALFGLEPGGFDGSFELFSSFLHPDDRERVLAAIDQAITTGADYNLEFRAVNPQGGVRWALTQGKVFYDPNGQPVRMAGIDLDITERKRDMEALQESEARFRQLAENINAVFWLKEVLANRVSYVSPAYERLWELNPQALYADQQTWVDYIHPDDREWVGNAFAAKAEAGQFDEEYRIVLADGRICWVHDRCFPLRNEAGKIYRFAGIAEDITDRKQTEQILQESETRFRTSVENMLDCFGIYSAVRNQQGQITDFRTEYVNDAACFSNHLTREQQLGRGLCELLPGHIESGLFDEYCQVVETGQSLVKDSLVYEDEYGQQRLTRAFDIRVAKFGDGYVATWRDITDRKQTEAALRQSEERYRTLFESMEDGFCVIEVIFDAQQTPIDYRFLEANPAFEHQAGLTQAVGQTARQLLPNIEAHWFEIYGNVVLTGESTRFENSSDALNRWFDVYAFRVGQPEERKVAILFKDISARKRAEQTLQESEARLSLAHKATRSGLWDWDMIHNKAQVSEEYCQLFGLDPATQEVSYDQWINWLHPDDRATVTEVVSRTIQQRQDYYEADYRILHPEGDRWIASKGQVFYNAAGDAVRMLGNVQDITDRKQAEAERERLLQLEQAARAEAERANRVKDEFLAVLSHELRSPLNPILGWAKLMQSRKFDAARTSEALATIERNAKLQCQLIDDLLDTATILRGKLSMNVAPVDLAFVIESAIETVRTAAVAKSILLHSVLPQIGKVLGDSRRLQQIVWNLLSNAIKFTPSHRRVDIRLERSDNQAQITVSDTGKGINPDFLPHIFDSFRQEDASTTRKYGGLGLGLAIVYQLVEAHGGTIAADSQGEGQGSTFIVRLPLLEAEPEASQLNESSASEPDLTGIQVLIVDDELDTRELLTAVLTQYGAEVLAAASAAEGLTCLASFHPNVLISDIGMPEMDGYTFLQQVRALPFDQGGQVPAIALTAYAREGDRQRIIAHGFQQHITKPFDLEQLVRAVIALTKNES
ncbi:MAG: PAS domain-containing protein [Oscillatoriophycideae cyanobacterium NC_groundwater_1537_Pr4_S-0.65um_50_18]|nr:PAS domain-containing protein [Oscillatoriophycideae cyanobacterium NC_groundwater_1537_Pr4_S-0.65um_50_18]